MASHASQCDVIADVSGGQQSWQLGLAPSSRGDRDDTCARTQAYLRSPRGKGLGTAVGGGAQARPTGI